jgi:hypothetical protein
MDDRREMADHTHLHEIYVAASNSISNVNGIEPISRSARKSAGKTRRSGGMSLFAPRRVATPHHFEIAEDGRGHWVARETKGLVGGLFRTYKDALHFALDEADGDAACVSVLPAEPVRRVS